MTISTRLQLLTCLMVYASSAHAITVKYGTNDGPIVPPAPVSSAAPSRPYRSPAPVWEERSNDSPDPNAQWRPQLFVPQPRYTQVIYNAPISTPQPISNAQRFVNAYLPKPPLPSDSVREYVNPSQFLSSQNLPGYGLQYFVPAYVNDLQERKENLRQEDAKQNQIETNEVNSDQRNSASDLQWKYEKDSLTKNLHNSNQNTASSFVYQWPAYVPPQHQ